MLLQVHSALRDLLLHPTFQLVSGEDSPPPPLGGVRETGGHGDAIVNGLWVWKLLLELTELSSAHPSLTHCNPQLALCANLLCLFGRSICVSAKLDHNHPLPQTLEASLPFAHSHEIPEELERVARDMAGWKLPHDIHNMLCRMASARRFPVSWTERDIQNRYPMLSGTPWQAEELLEKLATAGQAYQKHVDSESGVLQNLIWIQHQGDMEVVLSAEQCVIFDNTFNTNSLGFKFGVFSTVDRFGCTRLLACTLMLHETRTSFEWVLQALAKLLGLTPSVILTDGDLWLAEGILNVWVSTVHLLCTWHLSKNLLRHAKKCFATGHGPFGQSSTWPQFLRMWWVICWKSDTTCCATFDAEWGVLRQFLLDNAGDPSFCAASSSVLGRACGSRSIWNWARC